jgi:RNA polymerase sigma factor (sigma-70 family)
MRAAVYTDDVGSLVRAAADGDTAAWQILVERFSGMVWAVARGHGLASADAEEVFQTTWLRLTEHIGRINEPDRVGGWLATTARHEALRLIRTGQRVDPSSDLDVLMSGIDDWSPERALLDAEDNAADAARLRRLWQAFQDLPGRCQQLLRALLATPPPSYAEVADAFKMPVGSIGPTRARCLGLLRELLTARGITGVESGHG